MNQSAPRRLDRVLELIRENTLRAAENNFINITGLTASGLASAANLDRTNVSRELNRLYRQGLVIKCLGKPTLFLHREALATSFPRVFFPSTIPCGERLEDYLASQNAIQTSNERPADSLESMIGSSGSMKRAVQQAKAAVLYPPHGIHTLITGKEGIGKLCFSKAMYAYAKKCGRLSPDGKFVLLNCQDFSKSPHLLMAQIFGYSKNFLPGAEKGKQGLIEQAKGGILCLNGVHRLSAKVQELLTTLIEKNTFCRMGEASMVREGEAMIIATTTEPAGSPSIERFVRNMPMLIPLPDLANRGPAELLEHLTLLFGRESRRLQLPLRIHQDVLSCLLHASYPGQIGELKSCVKGICSLAYLEYLTGSHASSSVEISYHHLPCTVTATPLPREEKVLQIQKLLSCLQGEYVTFTPEGQPELPIYQDVAPEDFLGYPKLPISSEPLKISDVGGYINRCVNRMRITQSHSMEQLRASFPDSLCQAVDRVLEASPNYKRALENPRLYYGLLLHLHNVLKRQDTCIPNSSSPPSLNDIRRAYPKEYAEARKLKALLEESGGKPLPDSELCFITMYLYLSVNWTANGNVHFIAIFHGQGVSSGIASFLNNAVQLPLVHSIDLTPSVTLEQVLEQAAAITRSSDHNAGLIIFTDMLPFTDLHHHLNQLTGIRTEHIAGASMPLMLHMVEKSAYKHCSLIELMSEASGDETTAPSQSCAVTTSFLNRIIHEVLSPSLTFLNPGKAADTLLNVLNKILSELYLSYSDEIALKFIFHSAHMLERVIKGEPLKYSHLKAFINQHSALIGILERHLVYAEEVFGVSVPAPEKAYICEIFLPFIEEKPSKAPARS